MLLGLHHVTALAGDPQRNLDFYTRFFGLRLVKRTVNFDDPAAYHFYFGHGAGSPGTLLTFFPWPRGRRAQPGSGKIAAVRLRTAPSTLEDWKTRAAEAGASTAGPDMRFGRPVLTVFDLDGVAIELVEDASTPPGALGSLGAVTLRAADPVATGAFLAGVLGFSPEGSEGNRTRYRIGNNMDTGWIEIAEKPAATRETPAGTHERLAAGLVHHVAFLVESEEVQLAWRDKLVRQGLRVSPVRDRLYFHSIYFREPGGALFEIATAGPGFLIDETPEELGRRLCLPPWLERVRESIERRLPPLSSTLVSTEPGAVTSG
jgi:glyoxalase family protein